jgi:hypothetical protein
LIQFILIFKFCFTILVSWLTEAVGALAGRAREIPGEGYAAAAVSRILLKHAAIAAPATFNFAKEYLNVMRLREDIERIEQSSEWHPDQATADGKLNEDRHLLRHSSRS